MKFSTMKAILCAIVCSVIATIMTIFSVMGSDMTFGDKFFFGFLYSVMALIVWVAANQEFIEQKIDSLVDWELEIERKWNEKHAR